MTTATIDPVTVTAETLAVLPALAETIHATNVRNGFWPANVLDRDTGEICMLITSELSEALEEDRDGHDPVWFQIGGVRVYRVRDGSGADWTEDAKGLGDFARAGTWTGVAAKPEGAAVELADAAIRALDAIYSRGPRALADADMFVARVTEKLAKRKTFAAKLGALNGYVTAADAHYEAHPDSRSVYHLMHVLVGSLVLAGQLGEDPIGVVKLKMAYNETRGFRHGKAY